MEDINQHFRSFAVKMAEARAKYGSLSKAQLIEVQRTQVEHLMELEEEFRKEVIDSSMCEEAYLAFVTYVRDEKKNILYARPYFRERQKSFTRHVSPALKKRAWRRLLRFKINHQFAAFVMKKLKWRTSSRVYKTWKKILAARDGLVMMNLPLCVSRARIFWSRTPKAHMDYMDFIQTAVEGMISGVDKFSGIYSPDKWCNVAIGRITGNFIEAYSATLLHLFPQDRRKLYRANKFRSKYPHDGYEVQDLVTAVNTNPRTGKLVPDKQKTSEAEITDLLAASSTVSADAKSPDGSEEVDAPASVARYEAPEEHRPDFMVENAEIQQKLAKAMSKLSLVDKKLMRLKGLDIALT